MGNKVTERVPRSRMWYSILFVDSMIVKYGRLLSNVGMERPRLERSQGVMSNKSNKRRDGLRINKSWEEPAETVHAFLRKYDSRSQPVSS